MAKRKRSDQNIQIAAWIAGIAAVLAALASILANSQQLFGPSTLGTVKVQGETTSANSGETKRSDGYIYIGQRDGDRWAIKNNSQVSILREQNIPKRNDIVTLNGMVHLRRAVPPEDHPLAMTAELRVLEPGTRLRVESVTSLDHNEFYWAEVRVVGTE